MGEIDEIVRLVGQIWQNQYNKGLRDSEAAILRGSLERKSYPAIAQEIFSTPRSVNTTAQPIWDTLTTVLGVKVTKPSCSNVLLSHIETLRQLASAAEVRHSVRPRQSAALLSTIVSPSLDSSVDLAGTSASGLATDRLVGTDILYGREQDLELLKAALQGSWGRIVVLGGLSQTGKSPLTKALAEAVKDSFEHVVCLAAFTVPTVSDLAAQLVVAIGAIAGHGQLAPDLVLEQLFRHRRLLVVIDGLERLFQPQGLAGVFQATSTCYARWLQQLASTRLQGSLMLVSRAIPQVLYQRGAMRLGTGTVAIHPLKGWPSPLDRRWLEEQGVTAAAETEWQELLLFCGGHPELLDTTVDLILNEHQNDIGAFLKMPGLALQQMRRVLDEDLAPAERVLLPWLVLGPLRYTEIAALWIPRFMREQLLNGLESLERRNLLESHEGGYALYPLALVRCAADLWVAKIVDELRSKTLDWLHWCPLLRVDVPEWQQQRQQNYVLLPLIEQLQRLYLSVEAQTALIAQSIDAVQQSGYGRGPVGQGDYAMGNLLNIATAWGLPFKGFDVSGARLQQVDLRTSDLAGWQARNCAFVEAALPVPMAAPLHAAMSPAGDCVVIGDSRGRVVWWCGAAPALVLGGHYQFNQAIDAVTVTAGVIAIASGQQIFVWWLLAEAPPAPTRTLPQTSFSVPAPVTCLALDPEAEHLAAGLETGQVIAWDLQRDQICFDRFSHSHPVYQLVFNADGRQLASYDLGHRVHCHSLAVEGDQPATKPLEASFYGSFIGIGWHHDALYAIEYMGQTQRVIWRTAQREKEVTNQAHWDMAVCSGDGLTVAGYNIDGQVMMGHLGAPDQPLRAIAIAPNLGGDRPKTMQLNDRGDLLMLGNDDQVQLWHRATGQCLWRRQTTRPDHSGAGADLSESTGLSAWHQEILSTMGVVLHASQNQD